MDHVAAALSNHGIVLSAHLGDHPARGAQRGGLVSLLPRVYVAGTQPVGPVEQAAAVCSSVVGEYAFLGPTALWIHGVAPPPTVVQVGVRHTTRYRARPPVEVSRVAATVLRGTRVVEGRPVVALEVAVIQACAGATRATALRLVEHVLRERRTTTSRLRGRCRRGLAGSAVVRRTVDELSGTSLDEAVRVLRAALAARGVDGLGTELRFVSSGGATAYGDLVDEGGRTVIEVDGYVSHLERSRFRADRRRDRWLAREHDVLTLRVDAAEITDDLERLTDELADLVLRRRRAAAAGRPA